MRSLRHTLVRRVVAAVILLTAIAGVSFYLLARAYLIEQFDDELEERFDLLASSLEIEGGEVDLGFDDLDLEDFGEEDDDDEGEHDEDDDEDDEEDALSYLLITNARGTVYRSPTLGADGVLAQDVDDDDPVWTALPDGRRGRVYTVAFLPEPDLGDSLFEWAQAGLDLKHYGEHQRVTMSMARETAEIDAALTLLGAGLAASGGLLAVVMSIVVAYGVRRALRPVDGLTARLAAADPDTLGQPVEPGPLPEELTPIVEQYNALLARVAQAYQRERGFSADAAHELRTPLAGLRTTLEVALTQPRTPEQSAETFAELLEICGHMRILVEALLKLAELDAGRAEDEPDTVVLDDEVRRVWRLVRHNGAAHRRFETRKDLHADTPIVSRPGLLETILRNVMQNAADYVDEHGTVTLATQLTDRHARITVNNTGSTLPAQDAERVFDRFWRADSARAGTGRRHGLGLALTRSAVHALGGTIQAASQPGGSFVVTIQLPRTAPGGIRTVADTAG